MTTHKYATKDFDEEHMAKVVGVSLPISTKFSVEICRLLRNKNLQKAKTMLEDVIEMKKAVPIKRFTGDVGHKSSVNGPGRYPLKAAKHILSLLKSVESNAQFKGLNTQSLVISHICAHKAASQMRYGRQRGRETKATHVEIMVKEAVEKAQKKKAEPKKKEDTKVEEKSVKENKAEKKEEPKSGDKK